MALPASFQQLGIVPTFQVRKRRRLMIGSEGLTNTGKTEFIMSAPGPKILLALDRSFDSCLDNPYPPESRDLDNLGFDVIKVPNQAGGMAGSGKSGGMTQDDFTLYFKNYRSRLYQLLENVDLVTLGIDGDSDSWELQVMSDFGRTSQIHPMQYQITYAARRAMINRCWDSGKIIIATCKLKDKYEDIIDPSTGLPEVDEKTKRNKQRKVAGEYKRQGFPDQEYLWQLQIRHLFKPTEVIDMAALSPLERLKARREGLTKTKPEWGLRITKCKANPMLENDELWGTDCCFRGLVEHVYPNVNPTEWGFPA